MADLEGAYSIASTAEAQRVYAGWATTYDASFAGRLGYVAPQRIAALFLAEGGQAAQAVLDIGAGTGLVAEALPGLEIMALTSHLRCWRRRKQKGYIATEL